MLKKNRLRLIAIFLAMVWISLLSTDCYAGIRVKPHGKAILNPYHHVEERVISMDRSMNRSKHRSIKPSNNNSKISKVLKKFGGCSLA